MNIEFKAKTKDEADILIYGDIGESFFTEESITAKSFKAEIDKIGEVKQLNIYINSAGGNVVDGQAIYSMLKRHTANKTVYIDGLAASIASVIAMAGNQIKIPRNAMIMIHNAWGVVGGNAKELRKMSDVLDKVDETIKVVYAEKTGLSIENITQLMEAETWMTAEEAISKGFADELITEKKIAACMSSDFFNRYKNVPKDLVIEEEEKTIPETEEETSEKSIQDILAVYEQKIKLNNRRNDK
jgi:ATP-dependent Clp protease protease subunit